MYTNGGGDIQPDREQFGAALGAAVGGGAGTYQADAFKGHKHIAGDTPLNANLRYGIVGGLPQGNNNSQAGMGTTGGYTSTEGESETRPKNVSVNYIIKY